MGSDSGDACCGSSDGGAMGEDLDTLHTCPECHEKFLKSLNAKTTTAFILKLIYSIE